MEEAVKKQEIERLLQIHRIEVIALRAQPQNPGGLNLLEQFFLEAGFADAKQRIRPLRVLQNLRSGGAAHAKGSNYTKALKQSGLDGLPLVEASMKFLL